MTDDSRPGDNHERSAASDEVSPEVVKSWGGELCYARTDRCAGDILHVAAGHKLSVLYHEERDETSFLESGRRLLERGETPKRMRRSVLEPGAVWRNPPKLLHALEALEDLMLLEVSIQERHDVIRRENRYGRNVGLLDPQAG